MEKNKYQMIAGWETMGYLDKQSQEIAESVSGKKMLTSEAKFKFKKQLCRESSFFENLTHTEQISFLPNGKVKCEVIWENEYIRASLIFIEFHTNTCLL
ncbi:MAG: hypothetical protein IJ638_00635 [Alphaproteobacteria bacterium]|nr:hypothetical protein [Alphaproteobacteria bacterium]